MTQEAPKARLIKSKDIQVAKDRGRKDFGDLSEMMDSIAKLGLIQPIVVNEETQPDGSTRYQLVAGERRYRSMLLLGWSEMPCVLKSELTPQVQKEIELEENLKRKQLSWTEQAELLRQLDELKKSVHGTAMKGGGSPPEAWTTQKTGDVVGLSGAYTSAAIKMARQLREHPELREKAAALPMRAAKRLIEREIEAQRLGRLAERGELSLSTELKLGSCLDLIKDLEDNSVKLVVTDPPFGIEAIETDRAKRTETAVSNVYKAILEDSDNATEATVKLLLRELIPLLHQKMSMGAHLYMFCCMDLHKWLVDELRREKRFVVDLVPLIWYKGRHTSPFMGFKYQPCYEPIVFAQKWPKTRRLKKAGTSVITEKIIPSNVKLHPFEKPQALLRYFIEQSSLLGELVLDPFAGSGSTLIAAKRLKRNALGFELSEKNFHIAQKRLIEEA